MTIFEFSTKEEPLTIISTKHGRLKFRTDEAEALRLYAEMKGLSLDGLEKLEPKIKTEKGERPCLKKSASKTSESSSLKQQPLSKGQNAKG